MDSVLVISDEPALAETLAGELSGVTVTQARFKAADARLRGEDWRLVVIDEGDAVETGDIPVLRITRPVRLAELLYTIRERLQGKSAATREEMALSGDLRFSPSERLVRGASGGIHITLTEKETELLLCLLEAKGKPVARDKVLSRVWGYSDDIATHTLETHIYRLRGKLRQASDALDVVASEEGGYLLKL